MFRSSHLLYIVCIAILVILYLQFKQQKNYEEYLKEMRKELDSLKKQLPANSENNTQLLQNGFNNITKSLQHINNNILVNLQQSNKQTLSNLNLINSNITSNFKNLNESMNKINNGPKSYNYIDINSTVDNKLENTSTILEQLDISIKSENNGNSDNIDDNDKQKVEVNEIVDSIMNNSNNLHKHENSISREEIVDEIDEETKKGIEQITEHTIESEEHMNKNLTLKQLKSLAKQNNLSVSGNKTELYERLNALNII